MREVSNPHLAQLTIVQEWKLDKSVLAKQSS